MGQTIIDKSRFRETRLGIPSLPFGDSHQTAFRTSDLKYFCETTEHDV